MDVEPYVRACSLWVQKPGEEAVCVVPDGKLSLERLAQQPLDEAGAVHFLKLSDAEDIGPDSRGGLVRLFRRRARDRKEVRQAFRAGRGRLARVGYFSRFVDALYSIALLARGRVPGESAAAASVTYERIMAEHEHYRYHGRVLRQDGWIVLSTGCSTLQRLVGVGSSAPTTTSRLGEIFVYLSESEAGEGLSGLATRPTTHGGQPPSPLGVTRGREGGGPCDYVGAGSHASYYTPG